MVYTQHTYTVICITCMYVYPVHKIIGSLNRKYYKSFTVCRLVVYVSYSRIGSFINTLIFSYENLKLLRNDPT